MPREVNMPGFVRAVYRDGAMVVFAVLMLAAVSVVGCSPEAEETSALLDVSSGGPVATGAELFAANCAVCHGASGEGQLDWHVKKADGTLPPPPLNGDGHTWHHADGLLYRIVSDGGAVPGVPSFKSGMPALGDQLSHQETIDLLNYVKSLWGDKTKRGMSIRESQSLVSEQDPFPQGGSSN